MTIGQRIKAARLSAGMTQQELADKLGISFVGVSQWENDKRNPKRETLDKIAKVLGVRRRDLEDSSNWSEYDKGVDTENLAAQVPLAELVQARYGKEAVEILAHYDEINPQEWARLSKLIEEYARLDGDDRLILYGRIMQIIDDMLANEKYSHKEGYSGA